MAHRALADIKESIRELAYYRATAFVAAPGPTSEEAQAVAAQLLADGGVTPSTGARLRSSRPPARVSSFPVVSAASMAVVAQLVEHWLVVPVVAGSSPVDRPMQS